MDTLRTMKTFIAVVDEGSFAGAARSLNMSPPAVTRAIAQLENELGVKLLLRSTRKLKVTSAGSDYAVRARQILEDVEAANSAAMGLSSTPVGMLRVTAPVMFGQMFVTPTILEYLGTHSETQVDAVFLDRVVNMMDEDIDVAVRIGHLPDSSLRTLKVGSVRQILCASPEYLAKNGIPQSPADLQAHTLIRSSALNQTHEWRFADKQGEKGYKTAPRLQSSSNDTVLKAARAGFGIARVISYQAAPDLIGGSLKTVLEAYELPPWPINILHREDRLVSAKVRSFVDMLAANLRADPSLN